MKLNQTISMLAIALAMASMGTSCKHGPNTGITNIPGSSGISGETNPGGTLEGDGHLAAANPDEFEGMIKDPAALAAYTIHFAYDSAAIKKGERSNLQSVAAALGSDRSAKLLIEGNCDERGTEEYNRSLGDRRANAAREALSKLGVDPMRIRTLSNGKDKPADTGHDDSAWSKNRRDDFILLHPKAGA